MTVLPWVPGGLLRRLKYIIEPLLRQMPLVRDTLPGAVRDCMATNQMSVFTGVYVAFTGIIVVNVKSTVMIVRVFRMFCFRFIFSPFSLFIF
jgi:hypothetical protein